MDSRLLDILVCPVCKGKLIFKKSSNQLICRADKLAFEIRDNIPVMLVDNAQRLSDAEIDSLPR